MRDEYTIEELHPRRTPYATVLKQEVYSDSISDTASNLVTPAEQSGFSIHTPTNHHQPDNTENTATNN